MSAIRKKSLISIEDYLAGELVSPIKHEYLSGVVYAMAGANIRHNRIVMNLLGRLHALLRHQPCQPYNSDMKIRVRQGADVRFYYPDVSVICESNAPDDSFQDHPVVICEVLSESTRRIDEGEKCGAYLTISSLQVYALFEQDFAGVVVFRRTPDGFVREVYTDLEANLALAEIGIALPLREVYEGVEMTPGD